MREYKPMLFVSRSALEKNYHLLKAKAACRLWCVVKSNAYGHSLKEAALAFYEAGADAFAVANIGEAVALRALLPGVHILILGPTDPRETDTLCNQKLTQTVHSPDYAWLLAHKATSKLKVHIKIDIGMHRLGFDSTDAEQLAKEIAQIKALPNLEIDGIFAHLPSADCPNNIKTPTQIEQFKEIVSLLRQKGIDAHTHLSNSAGVLRYGSLGFDGVRCGMALYGISPANEVYSSALSPAMALYCPILQIRTIGKGEKVGYGGAYETKEPTRIATLPLGYADGLLRGYEGAKVSLYGKKVPLCGHICMTMCMADIGALPAEEGDFVRFFGRNQEEIFALAKQANTSHYEVLASLSPAISRIYTE